MGAGDVVGDRDGPGPGSGGGRGLPAGAARRHGHGVVPRGAGRLGAASVGGAGRGQRGQSCGPAGRPCRSTSSGAVPPLDAAQARAPARPRRGPRAYLLLRPWLPRAVRVDLDDPRDPTPYWYVSSRHPDRLAAARGAGPLTGWHDRDPSRGDPRDCRPGRTVPDGPARDNPLAAEAMIVVGGFAATMVARGWSTSSGWPPGPGGAGGPRRPAGLARARPSRSR